MKSFSFFSVLLFVKTLCAQIPENYYNTAEGLSGFILKTQLKTIISQGHVAQSYSDLYTGYLTTHTDNDYENDGTVLDFYSENPTGSDPYNFNHNTNRCGNQSMEGDCYNREHLVPQSVFSSAFPMQSDIHHVIPSDGRVNGFRGSFPFAEVATPNFTSLNGSQRGSSATAGYSGTVFEPIDEFKGDIARALLYFVTRYETQIDTWSFPMFNGTENQALTDWAVTLLIDWHTNDPVNQDERDRNNAAYNFQGNANPFVDHPEYVNLIWNSTSLPDNEAPTIPTNILVSNETPSSFNVAWTASTDNVSVISYDILINGELNKTVSTTTAVIDNLNASTTYSIRISAKDAANNSSELSVATNATTTSTNGEESCSGGIAVNETFQNIPTNSGSYSNRSWTGDNGGTWNATLARTDQTINNSRAILLDSRGTDNGTLTSPQFNTGIGSITVTSQRVFSGATSGTLSIKVNGNEVGTVPYSSTPQTTTLSNINITGDTTVTINDDSGNSRVAIDNLSWTCYSPVLSTSTCCI